MSAPPAHLRHILIVGGDRSQRLARAQSALPITSVELHASLLAWRPLDAWGPRPIGGAIHILNDADKAFPDKQLPASKLILTQPPYLLQKWMDRVGTGGRLILTADRKGLSTVAPDALRGRGLWRRFEVVEVEPRAGTLDDFASEPGDTVPPDATPAERQLILAFASDSTDERLRRCQEAAALAPKSAAVMLALASACRESGEEGAWRQSLDAAHRLAPKWEAVYYEDAKFWLHADDMARASASFQRACTLMPTFAAAWSNLGATLGELGHGDAALDAFLQALEHDADNFAILNNVALVTRDLGRLAESEDALQRAIALEPERAVGHYNLAHTRFLRRDFGGSLEAYEEGQRRDPGKDRRHACRLALVRFACGDMERADRELWKVANQASPDEREDLLIEAYDIASSVMAGLPADARRAAFLARIARAIGRA